MNIDTEKFVELDSVYTKRALGVPMTPGAWVSKTVEYIPVTRIRMSCGGGIGGAQWYEYINRVPLEEFAEQKHKVVTMWNGKRKLVNTRYMVEAEDFTIVKAVYDSRNPNNPAGKYIVARLVEDGSKVSLADVYQGTIDNDRKGEW